MGGSSFCSVFFVFVAVLDILNATQCPQVNHQQSSTRRHQDRWDTVEKPGRQGSSPKTPLALPTKSCQMDLPKDFPVGPISISSKVSLVEFTPIQALLVDSFASNYKCIASSNKCLTGNKRTG